ncbi:glycosyl hydrolase [Streptosporangium roseum]|uniref:glycosyl hydrolase n=1 Tax=Streptosporangium roseum TaxID=2001 RepID=UPI0033294BD4
MLAASPADRRSRDHRLLIHDIDAIAVRLGRLEDAGVPVLWRPSRETLGGDRKQVGRRPGRAVPGMGQAPAPGAEPGPVERRLSRVTGRCSPGCRRRCRCRRGRGSGRSRRCRCS